MERLLTGRRIGLSFGIDEDAFVLSGATTAADLPDQLRLLTAKLTHPALGPGAVPPLPDQRDRGLRPAILDRLRARPARAVGAGPARTTAGSSR
jgi:zinc protease